MWWRWYITISLPYPLPAASPLSNSGDQTSTTRKGSAREAIGGGVVRGLTKIRRFGNAEVQVAGNSTLVSGGSGGSGGRQLYTGEWWQWWQATLHW